MGTHEVPETAADWGELVLRASLGTLLLHGIAKVNSGAASMVNVAVALLGAGRLSVGGRHGRGN